jgi:HPt (histidine-containing phosphotransfer) domain-containing protein
MINNELEKNNEKLSNLSYLTEMMGGKKHLVRGIIDLFLTQVPEELQAINDAIIKTDYVIIKNFAHTMKSSVSMLGISVLAPILLEMENLGVAATDIEKIKLLNKEINLICKRAFEELEREKLNYE